MKKFYLYLLAQMKRMLKALPVFLLTTLLLAGCVAMVAAVMLKMEASSDKKQKVNIGLVGDMEGSYLGFGIQAVQSLDSSKFAITFLEMSEKEARDSLNSGKITAYLIIPDGFVDSLLVGENKPVTYVTTAGAAGIGGTIIHELIGTISSLLTESQSAMYGTQQYMADHGMQDVFWQVTDDLYLRFIDFILGRTMIYEMELLGHSGNLSMPGYYFCGFMVLFLLMWGISGTHLYVKRDSALPKILCAKGQGAASQVLGEYIAYFTLMLTCVLSVFVILMIGMQVADITLPEWEKQGNMALLSFFFHMIPVMLLIAAMQFLLFELTSDLISAAFLQFLSAVMLGYLSGCIYPLAFFPEEIQMLSVVLPTGVALRYAGKCVLLQGAFVEFVLMMGYLCVFLFLTVRIRKRKIVKV